ncbi:MAG TPA: efflux transporter outer membrane subunit [Pirellulales bacterium]|nr:efflux transporter outer membrane subunit [Pirellulales bacterium]
MSQSTANRRQKTVAAPIARVGRRCAARWRLAGIALVALLVTGGCDSLRQWRHNGFKVGPNYHRPPAAVAADWIDSDDPRFNKQSSPDPAWWLAFNDPPLNDLIDAAYRQNLDLQTAGMRILEARAQRNIAAGNLLPQSQQALAAYAHAQIPNNLGLPLPNNTFNIWATGFNATWELDFWGRYRRQVASANAELDASVDGYNDAIVLLLAEVADSYVQFRTYQQRLAFARQNVETQRGSLRLAEERFRNGTTTQLDVQQARSNLAQTQSLIPPLETGLRQSCNQLCFLLGEPPSDLAPKLGSGPIPSAPSELAIGIPAELLRRRPDVRRAERLVAAQCEQIGIAEADFFPRFGLFGFVGYTGEDWKNLFGGKSFTGLILPSFQWNILNYGRIRNNVRAQEARFRQTVLEYQQTVLRANREAEDALVAFVRSQEQAQRLQESVDAAQASVELVLAQYEAGLTDFNRVYNTESLLAQQQEQLASAQGAIALNLINVYQALGGGWQAAHAGATRATVAADAPAPESEAIPAPEPSKQPATADEAAENEQIQFPSDDEK